MSGAERHIGIMQPYFFPYIGYWQLVAMSDVFVVYDDGLYRKNGWIHRNRILGYGDPIAISTEIQSKSCNRRINETERVPSEFHVNKLLKSIAMRYAKAPYCKRTMDVIEPLLRNPEPGLVDYLVASIRGVMSYLEIETPLVLSSTIAKDGLEGVVDKVERICKTVGILNYVNPPNGEILYDRQDFASRGLKLQFIHRDADISYRQFGGDFVPDLSIIDVMMFNPPEDIRALLKRYTLT